MTLLPAMSFAKIPKCSTQKATIIGKYGDKGENSSPLLDTWSEVSGNLTTIEIRSKDAFSKLVIVLKDDKNNELSKVEAVLTKNKSTEFNLINEVKKQKVPVEKIQFRLFQGNTAHEFCYEDSSVIAVDGQDVKEVTK
jgi:hypothetical protein